MRKRWHRRCGYAEYCDAVVEKQSIDIDAVASASNTLRGFKEAVNDAWPRRSNNRENLRRESLKEAVLSFADKHETRDR